VSPEVLRADFITRDPSVGIPKTLYTDIGTWINKRFHDKSNINFSDKVYKLIKVNKNFENQSNSGMCFSEFVLGNSDQIFLDLLPSNEIWNGDCKKQFLN